MSMTINGTEPTQVFYNGTEVTSIILDGVEVWGGERHRLLNGGTILLGVNVDSGSWPSGATSDISIANGGKYHSKCIDMSSKNNVSGKKNGMQITLSETQLNSADEWTISLWNYKSSRDINSCWNGVLLFGTTWTYSFQNGDISSQNTYGMRLNAVSYSSTGSVGINGGAAITEQWVHVAIVNHNQRITLYINGVAKGTCTSAVTLPLNPLCVGASYNQYNYGGLVDDLIIVKGKAIWTSNFTPPTVALVK